LALYQVSAALPLGCLCSVLVGWVIWHVNYHMSSGLLKLMGTSHYSLDGATLQGRGNVELYAKLVYVLKRGVVNCTGNGGILKYVHQKTESGSAAARNGLTSGDWLDDDDDELLSSELNSLDSSASSPKKPKIC